MTSRDPNHCPIAATRVPAGRIAFRLALHGLAVGVILAMAAAATIARGDDRSTLNWPLAESLCPAPFFCGSNDARYQYPVTLASPITLESILGIAGPRRMLDPQVTAAARYGSDRYFAGDDTEIATSAPVPPEPLPLGAASDDAMPDVPCCLPPHLHDLGLNYQTSLTTERFHDLPCGQDCWYEVGGLARTFYMNDQRIEFTGMEATFGVEGIVAGAYYQRVGDWVTSVRGEFYLNQPYDRNILVDTPERAAFAPDFEIDTFQISQLLVTASNGNWLFAAGKMVTPFGRAYYPLYQNSLEDAPFIRTEAIVPRETGVLAQLTPGIWVLTAAITNGGEDMDTNSSKAIVARVGVDLPQFSCGASVKWQDGIGSEGQKEFGNYAGVDMMWRHGIFTLSGEAIYDQYGLRTPALSLNEITWGRDLYYRDENNGLDVPITGVGYYMNLNVDLHPWLLTFNYGDFYPEKIGDPRQDAPNHRGLVKGEYDFGPHWKYYSTVLVENSLPDAEAGRTRKGFALWSGVQFTF